VFCETILTINWLTFCRFKWHFALIITIRTCCFVHFSWPIVESSIIVRSSFGSIFSKTIITSNWFSFCRFEWYFAFVSAIRACCLEHLSIFHIFLRTYLFGPSVRTKNRGFLRYLRFLLLKNGVFFVLEK
jgi:hypothetical protein